MCVVASSSHDWVGVFALPTARMFEITPPIKIVDDEGVDRVAQPTYARGGVLLELNFAAALLRQGNLRLVRPLLTSGASSNSSF